LLFTENSFGKLLLSKYSIGYPFESQILKGNQPSDLIKLCEFNSFNKWNLIYKGSQHGFRASDFLSRCNNKANTLTILRAETTGFVFGRFTSAAWSSFFEWKNYVNAFLFSLTNKDNRSVKMKTETGANAILCSANYGPVFDGGWDICIADNSNIKAESSTDLGLSYPHPEYSYMSEAAKSF
jgi:hypothetical protein